jgi:hypothetical protein
MLASKFKAKRKANIQSYRLDLRYFLLRVYENKLGSALISLLVLFLSSLFVLTIVHVLTL